VSRKLPNLSIVLPAASKAKPWKVERRSQRREHVTFGRRVMQSRESFLVTHVGRYRHRWQADNAAVRSAQVHGGFAKSADGGLWPLRPFKAKP
jgi:hypothetical protein